MALPISSHYARTRPAIRPAHCFHRETISIDFPELFFFLLCLERQDQPSFRSRFVLFFTATARRRYLRGDTLQGSALEFLGPADKRRAAFTFTQGLDDDRASFFFLFRSGADASWWRVEPYRLRLYEGKQFFWSMGTLNDTLCTLKKYDFW